MRVHTAQALQSTDPLTDAFKGWDFEASGIAHHDRFDGAVTADQDTDLTFNFMGEFAEVARQLLGDDAIWRETTTIEMFEASKLTRL
jgi:hypothetical protein